MAERTTPGVTTALTIGGSDSSGGAGIQAHLKAFSVMDVYGASVITAITAQNTTGVKAAQVLDPKLIDAQIEAVAGDIDFDATTVGMLGNAAAIETVVAGIKRHDLFPLVVDPVMYAKGGDSLLDAAATDALIRKLLPLATVLTPNRREAAALLGLGRLDDLDAGIGAAQRLCDEFGVKAAVIKGFRKPDDHEGQAVDLFCDGQEVFEVASAWRQTENLHGAGCCFAGILTAALALRQDLPTAINSAKAAVSEAIRQTTSIGHGHSPVNILAYAKVKK